METVEGSFFTQRTWKAEGVRSLCWRGKALVDWVAGGVVHGLDGTRRGPAVSYAYRFDAATATPDGRYAVIFERLGTKGLLLRDGEIVRELNRSFYHAGAYEYPVCLFVAPSGAVLLAHCPDDYNRMEVDDVETGERLTGSSTRKPADFFHSRLRANLAGTRLLSAGWVWHPWDAVVYFDVGELLRDPTALDRLDGAPSGLNVSLAEESSACWQTDTRVLLGSSAELEDEEEAREQPELRLRPCGVAVYDVVERRFVSSAAGSKPPGMMMAVGADHVLALHEHPRIVSLTNGGVVHEWPGIASGAQTSSIIGGAPIPPPIALDPIGMRFAVASADTITVVELRLPA